MEDNAQILEMTADIVSAYVGNNNVQASEVPGLISSIHAARSRPVPLSRSPRSRILPYRCASRSRLTS